MNKFKKGDIAEISRPYNPMKTDSREIEMLIMETPVNGNRNKRLKDFIESVVKRVDTIGFSGGLNRIFTIHVKLNKDCEL